MGFGRESGPIRRFRIEEAKGIFAEPTSRLSSFKPRRLRQGTRVDDAGLGWLSSFKPTRLRQDIRVDDAGQAWQCSLLVGTSKQAKNA